MASNLAKRKPFSASGSHGSTGASRKRAKTFDARTLAVQSTDSALSITGELDVAAYAAARAFEIQALENGMQRSKDALTTRAFQKVPRSLRRRTASHNVKRVPRRLRARAKREMIEDKTPTVTSRRRKPTQTMRIRLETARRLQNLNAKSKARLATKKGKEAHDVATALKEEGSHPFNTAPRIPKIKKNKLSRPPPPEAKFKKRQRCKTWLPTHMFHAKRAHMATTKNPIWRFAIPVSPTEKSYRPTHRARGSRGAVAWDMSYMSTVQLEGKESCIEAVLRTVGVNSDDAWGSKGKKWRAGTRSLPAWTYEKDLKRPLAPVTFIWCAQPKDEDVEMTSVDESQPAKDPRRKLWVRVHPSAFLHLWTDLLESSKRQNPPVMVEDLRFDIGSIEITGPGSAEALLAALRPVLGSDGQALGPQSPETTWSSLLGVSNPSSLPQNALLSFAVSDPRLQFPSQTLRVPDNESHMNDLAMLLAKWSPDQTQGPSPLFERSNRLAATRQLPSQKAINRRRGLAGPGVFPAPQPNDPQIPVMILANKPSPLSKQNTAPGSWTVLLPWKCVVPVWYSIMYYPLSSGGNPRFGGLKEQQQLAFEAGGTKEAQKSQKEWERRPKGRRSEFNSLALGAGRPKGEIGHGWACDWERLLQGPSQDVADAIPSKEAADADSSITPPLNIHSIRYPPSNTDRIISNLIKSPPGPGAIAPVNLTLCSRGTPVPCARIYRLPSDPALRQKWLSLASPSNKNADQKHKGRTASELSDEEARRQLAESLLSCSAPEGAAYDCLEVPTEDDLIGFVTSGNYNLSEGKGTGIGSILLSKVLIPNVKLHERKMCIVRAAGEKLGRLGTWELV
ncbi:uncharacterized protein N7484_001060 [Penicillium longicatenatum]|uniref:uncharacterized protein n=1 Tax=Penicillium longicatenatum TaxID=1561947 RepID=UPI002547BA92|nr:uncharacterized protein N7484_001060 [Penicillium longicatenatum]KAJ5657411.1 hypothetical protein N7484_001060 [Penicillium longicatenatum]